MRKENNAVQFDLKDLKKNLGHFAKKYGDDFVVAIGNSLENCDDLQSLETSIDTLFRSKGTTYYMATAEFHVRLSEATGSDESRQSENQPIQNETTRVVGEKIDSFSEKEGSSEASETQD